MINITQHELDKLERIFGGTGTFGTVYKKDDDTAYKIYFPTVTSGFSRTEKTNPSLLLPTKHFERLKRRSKLLSYTGGIIDTISVDGKFQGVAIPFYDGKTLEKCLDLPYQTRLRLCREMVRNSKELAGHFIYPTDYKTNNVMLSNGVIRFIDLDDIKTHVCAAPNLIYSALSVNSLSNTIQSYMKENTPHIYLSKEVSDNLERENGIIAYSYGKLEDYLDHKSKEIDVLFFDLNNIEEVITTISAFSGKKIVMVIREDQLDPESILKVLEFLKANGVLIYDIVLRQYRDQYQDIENVRQAHELVDRNNFNKVYEKRLH